ncbi:MAG: ATP-grasp domain-containing protein, partial [Candidatus Kerfeldbacteria bacterium]|nr:ATP-grasp domain-containing protein [Candidatus Kerfeldbacteria bacterium]
MTSRRLHAQTILTILYGTDRPRSRRPSFGDDGYKQEYERMWLALAEIGIRCIRSPLTSYREGRFMKGWEYKGGRWQRTKPYRAEMLWDKASERYRTHKQELAKRHFMVNHPVFSRLTDDKLFTSLLFFHLSPRTVAVKSPREIARALQLIRGSKLVLKPNAGLGGKGIHVIDRRELRPSLITGEMIVQEFIETKKGIRDISIGRHDLRIELLNEKIFRSYVRIAQEGKYLANFHQGGSGLWVPQSRIPRSVLPIVREISLVFRQFTPLYYTIDFLFDRNDKPWVVEINCRPGIKFPAGFH